MSDVYFVVEAGSKFVSQSGAVIDNPTINDLKVTMSFTTNRWPVAPGSQNAAGRFCDTGTRPDYQCAEYGVERSAHCSDDFMEA